MRNKLVVLSLLCLALTSCVSMRLDLITKCVSMPSEKYSNYAGFFIEPEEDLTYMVCNTKTSENKNNND